MAKAADCKSAFEEGRTLQENLVTPNPQTVKKLEALRRMYGVGPKVFFDADNVSQIPIRGGTAEEEDLTRQVLESFQEMRHPEGRFLPLRVKAVDFGTQLLGTPLKGKHLENGKIKIFPDRHSDIADELGTIAHEPGHGLGGTATAVDTTIDGKNTRHFAFLNQGIPVSSGNGLTEFVAHSNALTALKKAQAKFRKGTREWELYEEAIQENLRQIRSPGSYPRHSMQNTIEALDYRNSYSKEDAANYLGQLSYLDDAGKPGKMLLPDGVPLAPEMDHVFLDFLNNIARKGSETLNR